MKVDVVSRAYGIALVVLTPVIWRIWENPVKWEPGVSIVLFVAGCVVPVVGIAFIVGGERFYQWTRPESPKNSKRTNDAKQ